MKYIIRPPQEIYTFDYPFSNLVNDDIHQYISDCKNYDHGVNLQAKMTGWQTREPMFLKIARFVEMQIPNIVPNSNNTLDSNLELESIWGVYYGKGDYSEPHKHRLGNWSFVYFVKSPKNSSPLVFTNTRIKIKPKEGMCVLFNSNIEHHVPKNKSEGRSVIAGNFKFRL